MKTRGNTTGAAAKIEAWRRAGKELRDELVSTRDRLTVELQAAEAALAELDGGTAPPPPAPRAPRAMKAPRPEIAPVRAKGGRKPRGGVSRNGKGWRWMISVDGKKTTGATVPTEAEARAGLDAFLATNDIVPVAPVAQAPAPKAVPTVEPKEDVGASPWLPMGQGWGKPDENGLAKHLSCNGRGCDGCKGNGYGRAKLRERKAA